MQIKNAIITKTGLGFEGHGFMTCWLELNCGGFFKTFGGYRLDMWQKEQGRSVGTAYGLEFIMGILRALDVESWEKLVGEKIRVQLVDYHCKIQAIGHFFEDQWFDPSTLKASLVGAYE